MKKRVLSLLMAIAICLSMLPSAALAEIPGTGTNEVQTEQQITDEQKPEEQIPDEQNPEQQKPDEQKPDEQKPDEQNPDEQNPDKQNPDEQKPAKAPRKAPAAETHTGDHGGYTLPEGKTWQGVSSLPSDSGYYYLTQNVTIGSTWKPADGTVLCLNGYSISMTNNGPVIHVQPDVTFTLCDCNGSQNRYTHGITHGGNGRGAGVLVGQSATTEDTARTNGAVFNMYGGAIFNNYPWKASGENAASASGVLIGGGTFNMYGGKITENKLTEDGGLGGGVFVANQGSFHMSGGEISGNTAKEGGGVFVGGSYGYHDFSASAGGTFTMSGGKITDNSGTGGGVYVSSGSNTSFTVSGSAQITGNTSNNVYLGEYNGQSNPIKVDGVLDRTASIGVSVETANQVVATGISEENAKCFTSDNKKYSLQYDSTSKTLTLVGHDNHPICGKTCTHGNKHDVITNWRSISTEAELNAVIMGGCYYLTQDVEITSTWEPANGVTLCLNGHSITLVGRDHSSVIKVESGTFTLCDCSGDSGKITNGYKDGGSQKYPGRGVSVSKNGTFTMYGGSITGNTEGGVFVGSNRTFTMNGGSITGNTVTGSGGGVYVASGAEFTMNGGEISGNTSSSYGGGVYVYNGAEFTMTGGSITDNVAGASNENKSYGGGVYVQKDAIKFTMTGGSITGNKAKYGGGVWTGASFTVSGNVNITGNVGIDSKTASNVLRSLGTITIGGKGLKPEAKIGVTYGNTIDPGKFVTIATGAKDSCTADNFTADAGEPFGIKVESAGIDVNVNLYNGLPHIHYRCNGKDENGAERCNGIGHTEKKVLEFTPWTDANELPTASGEYYLTTDVTLEKTWYIQYTNGNVRFVLCLNGHSIKLKNGESGNVINIGKNATLALCDCNGSKAGNGKITGSKASGVNIANNGAFVMYGGSISGNGTGVSNDMLFHMYGGSITGNNRGVNVNSNDFIVAGKVNITGNTTNVYLPAGKTITVIGALGTGAQIGVTTANEIAEGSYLTIAKGIDKNSSKYTLTETDLNAFTSDRSYGKRLNGNSIIFTNGDLHTHALCGASCTHTGTHTDIVWQPLTYNAETQTLYYGSVEAARSTAKGSIQNEVDGKAEIKDEMHYEYTLPSGNYYLVEDITLAGNGSIGGGAIKISSDVNLCLNGKTLSTTVKAYNVDVIGVNSQNGKCTLTLCDCDTAGRGTITSQNRTNSGVQIYGYFGGGTTTYGNLVMYGGTVKGFRNGVVVGDGTFNMFGGTITGNEYGVSISSDASFTIGGTVNITGNKQNVDLGENVTITIDKSLTQESHIGITIAKEPTADNPVQFATDANNAALDYTGIFTPDAKDKSYVVSKGGDGSLFLGLHQHSWSYTANGATITATCTAASCPLKDKNGGSYTITVPDNLIYDGNGKAATVTGSIPGVTEPTITYKKGDTALDSAPTDVGKYTASITLGEGKNAKTASVEYSITAKEVTVTGITATDRYYAKDNLEVTLTGGTLTGVISGDTVTIDLTKAKGMMTNANVGTNKAVTVTGVALGGADKGNYKLKEQPTGVTVNITRADAGVIITGAPTSKTYGDADFTLTATNGVTESTGNTGKWTWISSDDTVLEIISGANTATPTIKVKKADTAGATLTVTYSSITHYGTAKVTIKVNKKDVTITGLSAGSKVYDGNTTANATGAAVINGKVGSDDVTVTAGTASFDNENVGTDKTVTFTGYSLSGADAGNYNLKAQPASVTANIAAKDVKLTGGINATDRSYVKDNKTVDLTKGTLTFDGLVSGETLDVNLPATGTISDAKVGVYNVAYSGVTLKDGTGKASNYKLVSPLPTVTVNITKATAPTLKNITVSQKYSVTTGEKAIGTVMPADAGTLTYTKGAESKTGSVTVTSWAVDSTGKVTYTLSGGAADNTVTLPVIIKSTNYADATVNVVITLTAKDIPNITAKDIVVTYDGNPIPADKITGTANVAGTWKWKADTAVTDVSDSGPKTVVFKPADSVNYAEVEKTITVTINQAIPTGEPKYTEIKTGGKTLADAGLTTADSNLSVPGTVKWVDDTGNVLDINTKVEANKEYKWLFTPTNANYTTLTGTIVLYPASTGIVIYTPVNDAIFLSGANQIVAPGSAATFRINKNFGEFRSVAVDGVTLDKSNYRAWSGSTYVKLTPAYMKTLSAGTHTLAVYFTGATATTTFTISAGSSNPATGAGDFAGVGAAVAMAAVSLLGAAAVLRRK
ncbi:MAG: hypothetical protein DBY18_03855 [Clostridia bacterium]|nr:MAG: hypothetical protein DBY18_03855 [Clostridia bacterium]